MTSSLSTPKNPPRPLQTSDLCHRCRGKFGCQVTFSSAQTESFLCKAHVCRMRQSPLQNRLGAKIGGWIWDRKSGSSLYTFRSYYLPDRDPLCDSVTVKEAPPYIPNFFDKYCPGDETDIDDFTSTFVSSSHPLFDREQTPICEEIRGEL